MTEKTERVFVYGTLKKSYDRDDYYVYGVLYNVGQFPAIKLGGSQPLKVWGQILEVTPEVIEELDIYEGVPRLYRREKTIVYDDRLGETFEAWVYEWAKQTEGMEIIDKWPVYRTSR